MLLYKHIKIESVKLQYQTWWQKTMGFGAPCFVLVFLEKIFENQNCLDKQNWIPSNNGQAYKLKDRC